jgi:FAD dependent monooxygenase
MTPNIGQGANTAIEDAAVLASSIYKLAKSTKSKDISNARIELLFREFKASRDDRVQSTVQRAHFGARFHTRDNYLKAFVGRYIFPYIGGFVTTRTEKVIGGGNVIDFLPLPKRLAPRSEESGYSQEKVKHSGASWAFLSTSLFALYVAYTLFRSM